MWSGTFFAARNGSDRSVVLHDIVFTDVLPDFVTFIPNTAEFVVTNADGTTTSVSVAGGTASETVTALPDGRTEIVFTSPAFDEAHQITWRFNSTIDMDAPITAPGNRLTNNMSASYSDEVASPDSCGADSSENNLLCDTGSVTVFGPNVPLITKTVDDESIQAGDELTYTIGVTIPANQNTLFDANIRDRMVQFPAFVQSSGLSGTMTCVSGCPATDPAFIEFPFGGPGSFATWFLGDLEPAVRTACTSGRSRSRRRTSTATCGSFQPIAFRPTGPLSTKRLSATTYSTGSL